MADSKSWREIRSKLALNEARVDTYRRLMDAQLQIAELLLRRGLVTEAQLDDRAIGIPGRRLWRRRGRDLSLRIGSLCLRAGVATSRCGRSSAMRPSPSMRTDAGDASGPMAPPPELGSGGQISGSDAS